MLGMQLYGGDTATGVTFPVPPLVNLLAFTSCLQVLLSDLCRQLTTTR